MSGSKLIMLQKEAGETIFMQGDSGKTMYKVISGKVGVYLNYGSSEQIHLATLSEQNCFGEMALLNKAPRSATVVSLEKTLLLVVNEENFSTFVMENPHNAYNIMVNLARMVENSTAVIARMDKKMSPADQKSSRDWIKEGMLKYYGEMELRQGNVTSFEDGMKRMRLKI